MESREWQERALTFSCHGERLVGILHTPEGDTLNTGVVVVVGGPQYRVGSHRQFVMLARQLAPQGYPVLRFDYRGLGDSEGEPRDFEDIDADIRAAVDTLCAAVPQLDSVVIWGLCDAASAALFYAHQDPRVKGLVLLNPWIRTEKSLAGAYLWDYYRTRLTTLDTWTGIFAGGALRKLKGLWETARTAMGSDQAPQSTAGDAGAGREPFPSRMLAGMSAFSGKVLLILSGEDITASEFRMVTGRSRRWQKALRRQTVTQRELAQANHTFARRNWRLQVADLTADWLRAL